MLKSARISRLLCIFAAAGFAASALVGCGAISEAKEAELFSEESKEVPNTVVNLDETPFTYEERRQGAQVAADFLAHGFDQKLENICPYVVVRNGSVYERLDGDRARRRCADQNYSFGIDQDLTNDEKQMAQELFTAENLEVRANGNGTASVLFQGRDLGLALVKVEGAGPLLDMRDVDIASAEKSTLR